MSKLFISLPGETAYQVYKPDPAGEVVFSFVSFDNSKKLRLPMSLTEDESFERANSGVGKEPVTLEKEQYLRLLSQAISHIKERDLGKIVISREQQFHLKADPVQVFKELASAYPPACVYLFSHRDTGTWMGATPELLLQSEAGLVKTMSLAGTQRKGEEKHFSAKEEVEQQLVTDYILSLFEDEAGLGEVVQSEPQLHAAGNLVHFKTTIGASALAGFSVDEFLHKLHPTPAVGGYPKKDALEFIYKQEGYDREFYAGYFGLTHSRDFQFFVNLRCMQVFENSVMLYAGGGITRDSDPMAEWRETEAKMQTLLNVLQPHSSSL